MTPETPALDALLEEIETLKKARDLLFEVYIGGISNDKIPDKTLRKLQDFYGYDDSE